VPKRGTLRASDDDREQIVERLRTAAVEGRLASHELEHRVTTALRARTYGELDETVADLPGGSAISGPRASGHWAVTTVRAHPALLLVAIPVAALAVATLVAITVLWSAVMIIALMLGHRGRIGPGPWMYAGRRHRRTVHRAEGPPRGYWA
jgi:hypothetical protein